MPLEPAHNLPVSSLPRSARIAGADGLTLAIIRFRTTPPRRRAADRNRACLQVPWAHRSGAVPGSTDPNQPRIRASEIPGTVRRRNIPFRKSASILAARPPAGQPAMHPTDGKYQCCINVISITQPILYQDSRPQVGHFAFCDIRRLPEIQKQNGHRSKDQHRHPASPSHARTASPGESRTGRRDSGRFRDRQPVACGC